MRVVGRNDVAWLAAISEWLFDFRISIVREDGGELYRNCEPGDNQIYFVFKTSILDEYGMTASDQQGGQLQIRGRTYILKDAKTASQ